MKIQRSLALLCSATLAAQAAPPTQVTEYREPISIRYDATTVRLNALVVQGAIPGSGFVFRDTTFAVSLQGITTMEQPAGHLLLQIVVTHAEKKEKALLQECAKAVRKHLTQKLHRAVDQPEEERLLIQGKNLEVRCSKLEREIEEIQDNLSASDASERTAAAQEQQRLVAALADAKLEIATQAPMVRFLTERVDETQMKMEVLTRKAEAIQSETDKLQVKILTGVGKKESLAPLLAERRRLLRASDRQGKTLDIMVTQLEHATLALQQAGYQSKALQRQLETHRARLAKLQDRSKADRRLQSIIRKLYVELDDHRAALSQIRLESAARRQVTVLKW